MKIAIGADHRGFNLKERLKRTLTRQGYQVVDVGTRSSQPCDYPDIGYAVARQVSRGQCARGILICHSGVGMSIVANKVPGIRAALVRTQQQAILSRQHNDANVLVVGSAHLASNRAEKITEAFLGTEALGERHARRVQKIAKVEQQVLRQRRS